MPQQLTFLLADPYDLSRAGLRVFAQATAPEAAVIDLADASRLPAALASPREGRTVVVVDYPHVDTRQADEALALIDRYAEVGWVVCTAELEPDFIRRLSRRKGVSIVLKTNAEEEIRSALRCAARGERFFCHQVTDLILNTTPQKDFHSLLTTTEKEVLRLIAQGLTVKEIAAQRHSSAHTIITHKKNIFRKLKVNNVYEATKYALRAGLVEMVEYYI